jgi:Ser/Thr protein kinase RdoA (MazF antagonist)
VRTRDGSTHADLGAGGRWRVVTRLPGTGFDVCQAPELAHSAGLLVGAFHAALVDFDEPLHPLGFVFHDTPSHLADLERSLATGSAHRLYAEVAALARRVLSAARALPVSPPLPSRVIHGDLKFNNVLFLADTAGGAWRAHALIDLDTLSRMPLWVELGDALRSWCNRRGEDSEQAELDLGYFRAAIEGYLARMSAHVGSDELASLTEAIERMALELAARFATDALEERYFGWNRERFPASGEHNLLRARGQLSLAEQARATREEQLRFLLS